MTVRPFASFARRGVLLLVAVVAVVAAFLYFRVEPPAPTQDTIEATGQLPMPTATVVDAPRTENAILPPPQGKPFVPPPMPAGWNLGDVSAKDYSSLKARAESGDAIAATQVYLLLLHCEEIRASTWTPEFVEGMQQSNIDVERALKDREAELEHCAVLSEAEMADRTKWLVQAADAGYLEARWLYGAHLDKILGGPAGMMKNPAAVEAARHRAIGYLRDSAAQGNVDAMFALARDYDSGILVARDPIVAHGLRIAGSRLQPSSNALRQMTERSASSLSPAQRQAAEAYARQFLENHKGS
ncbi:hypothetical protein [Silanimonas sp.]|uniref:hypothetical protein n=1 Tax=Silanimonas sp. TaxID=1929290 RepID=UPI0037CBD350